MAQAHRRLGARVTLLQRDTILPKDAPELVAVLRETLTREGIDIVEGVAIEAVRHEGGKHAVDIRVDRDERTIAGSHLLIAAGRSVDLEGLNLEQARIEYGPRGIQVDARLRTSNRRVHAMGDCAGGPQFTHVAGYQAGILIRNLAFRQPAKVDYSALPWVTYTDPELAHVGLTLAQARERYGDKVKSLTRPLNQLDRAVAEGRGDGLLEIVAKPNGTILGCSILAPGAGELIGIWCLALSKSMKLKEVAGIVLPYPTFSEISKQAAGEWYKPALFSDRTRKIVRLLRKLPRWLSASKRARR